MATKKQKQELLEILKFTPQQVKVTIWNYGGECYMGRVDRKIYEFFKEHKIDLDEYASDWDEKFNFVPDELRPFPPGSPYECDDMCHAGGPEISDSNRIEITDEAGNTIWECAFGLNELEEAGVEVSEWETAIIDDEPEGTVIFWGGQGEKGTCFGGDFELKQPFDPKKLKISYSNCDGWWIANGVSYDEEDIDNNDLSTTGKWGENKWIIVGDEEVYEGVSRDDIDEEELPTIQELEEDSKEWDPAAELDKIFEDTMTEWFTPDIKPTLKGSYEVELLQAAWPFGSIVRAEWTGRSWKQNDEKIKIKQWRGLNYDPNKELL
jgi:hypothetical protein